MGINQTDCLLACVALLNLQRYKRTGRQQYHSGQFIKGYCQLIQCSLICCLALLNKPWTILKSMVKRTWTTVSVSFFSLFQLTDNVGHIWFPFRKYFLEKIVHKKNCKFETFCFLEKQIMVSSNLPKNERWDNFHLMKLSQCLFFGRSEDTINCF